MLKRPNKITDMTVFSYGVAVILAIAAVALYKLLVWNTGQSFPPYLLFIIVTITTGVFFGFGPGVVATLVSAILVYYFIIGSVGLFYIANVSDTVGLFTFIGMGIFISVLAEVYKRTKEELDIRKRTFYRYQNYGRLQKIKGYIGFFLASIILIAAVLVNHQSVLSVAKLNEKDAHTEKVINYLGNLMDSIMMLESKQHLYVITGLKRDIDIYKSSYIMAQDDLKLLEQLMQDDPDLQLRLFPVVALVNDKFDFSEKAIELRRKKGSPVAEDLIATGRGNQLMANIRKQVFKIENYEQNLKQQYKDEKGYQFKKATSLLFAGDILSILLFISTFIFLRVEIIRRREVEYELIGLNDELKTKNEKHLQTERLLQKITSDLSESNKELELFAYVSSHDLKQPIRMIVSFMQLFEKKYKGKVDAEGEKYIKFIVDGAKQMDELIEALLDYSHISKTSLRTFALTEMAQPLKQAMNNLKMNIEETHANITYDDDLPAVKMEPALMTQLFQNLIANAIKFKGKNPPQVHVRAYKEGNDWVFCVKDNGIGISETFFDKIFVVFYKLHIKSECPGSGIGLAICKRIVEHHGGRIWVESKEGHGSTFFFSIPA